MHPPLPRPPQLHLKSLKGRSGHTFEGGGLHVCEGGKKESLPSMTDGSRRTFLTLDVVPTWTATTKAR